MYTVYVITNCVNDKIYVGYTGQTLFKRFEGHYSEPRDTIISRNIRKYGKEYFTIEPLCEYNSEHEAKQKEIELIAAWQTNVIAHPEGMGMNMTDGGEGARGYKHSTERRHKFSNERKGKNTGPRIHTRGRIQRNSRRVYVFTPAGEFIRSFESVTTCANILGIDNAGVTRCCQGHNNTIKGYVCQYNEAFDSSRLDRNYAQMVGSQNPRSRACYVFENNNTTVFGSLSEASAYLNVPYSTVKSVVRSKSHKIAGTDVYVSYDSSKPEDYKAQYSNTIQQIDPITKETVAIFGSIAAAANALGVDRSGIDKCLMGKNKTSGGFVWERGS